MKRSDVFLYGILLVLIVSHLTVQFDFSAIFSPANKGPATGVIVSILGIIALALSERERDTNEHAS